MVQDYVRATLGSWGTFNQTDTREILGNYIKGNSSYNTTYLTQGKSLEILFKEPWSVWTVYIQVTVYSTKPPIFGRLLWLSWAMLCSLLPWFPTKCQPMEMISKGWKWSEMIGKSWNELERKWWHRGNWVVPLQITPFTTQVISCLMIDIVIWINYKLSCLLPYIPGSIANTGSKHKTSFVNADVVRITVFRKVYHSKV